MSSTKKMLTLQEIANTSGRNDKLALLAAHPELKGILKAAYDPFMMYYIKPTINWVQNVGISEFDNDTNKLLNHLMSRRLSGNAAKQAVIAELSRLEPLSQTLLLNILNKDLCIGLAAKSINKVFPGLISSFPVQLAKLYEGKMQWPCLGSYKIDGLRCIYQNGKLYSRKGHVLVGLEHIAEKFASFDLARVDGEIIVPGKRFDDLSGEIRAFRKTDDAQYMVFDVHSREPLPLYKRQVLADNLCNTINDHSIQYVQHRTLRCEEEAMDMYDEAIDLGFEGLVIKKEDGLAFDGRNNDWQKIKPVDTVDVEVTGIELGTGKYENMVGSLVCDFNGKEIHVGGGLSDFQRVDWVLDPNAIVGKTIEVSYMELSKNGALRHPRLKCVRGDK